MCLRFVVVAVAIEAALLLFGQSCSDETPSPLLARADASGRLFVVIGREMLACTRPEMAERQASATEK